MARGDTEDLNIVLGSLHLGVHPPPRSRGPEGLDMLGWSDGVTEGVKHGAVAEAWPSHSRGPTAKAHITPAVETAPGGPPGGVGCRVEGKGSMKGC